MNQTKKFSDWFSDPKVELKRESGKQNPYESPPSQTVFKIPDLDARLDLRLDASTVNLPAF
jgi:hypothetical protein